MALVESQVVHRHIVEPVVARGQPIIDHAALACGREPGGCSEESTPCHFRQLVRIRRALLNGLECWRDPVLPDRPFFISRTCHFGEERKRKVLDMRPDSLVREQAAEFLRVPNKISVSEIGEHLPDLGAAEQVLFRPLEERHQRFRLPEEHSGKAVVEETLVAKSVAAPVEGDHALRRQLIYVIGRESVQRLSMYRKLLSSSHLVAEGLHHLHPMIRRGCDSFLDRLPLLLPIPVKELRRCPEGMCARRVEAGFEKEGQVLRDPQKFKLTFPE